MNFFSEKLTQYGLYLLGRRSYTVQQMRKKLETKAKKLYQHADFLNAPADIEKVIQHFLEIHLLDDNIFADQYIRGRIRQSPRGKKLMALELQRKGIGSAISAPLLDSATDESVMALEATRKKYGTLTKIVPQKRREKLFRFLLSRGFSYETSRRVLDSQEFLC